MVGSSMGARLVLEMARRGRARAVVALDLGGFWKGWERTFFETTITASIGLVRALRALRALRAALSAIARNVAGRTALMAQLSTKPWALEPALIARELRSFAETRTFDDLGEDLANGSNQQGPANTAAPVVIGWGRKDRLCLPQQAGRAIEAFPKATIHWFESSGHFRCGTSHKRRSGQFWMLRQFKIEANRQLGVYIKTSKYLAIYDIFGQ